MNYEEFIKEERTKLTGDRLQNALEAILFLAGGPVTLRELERFFDLDQKALNRALLSLKLKLLSESSALKLAFVEDSCYLSLKEDLQALAERFYRSEKNRTLSPQAYECLAAIAYHQPATRAQVEAVRGCNSDSLITRLLAEGLIVEAGKLDLPGRPQSFCLSERFLQELGLSSVKDLPPMDVSMFESLKEFEN